MIDAKSPSLPFTEYDLLNAWRYPGCPVCQLSARSVKHYLASVFQESVRDPDTRVSLLSSRGFCAEHVSLLITERIANETSASVIYGDMAGNILRDISAALSSMGRPSKSNRPKRQTQAITKFIKEFRNDDQCSACKQREMTVDHLLNELSGRLRDDRMREALQKSDGLCLPHLAQLLERVQSAEDARFLLNLTQEKLQKLQSEMLDLIRQQESGQTDNLNSSEATAWRNVMRMISGAQQ